ncbi:hypothetical protein LINPERHAP1_LOCUS10553 [Linum perenne]
MTSALLIQVGNGTSRLTLPFEVGRLQNGLISLTGSRRFQLNTSQWVRPRWCGLLSV